MIRVTQTVARELLIGAHASQQTVSCFIKSLLNNYLQGHEQSTQNLKNRTFEQSEKAALLAEAVAQREARGLSVGSNHGYAVRDLSAQYDRKASDITARGTPMVGDVAARNGGEMSDVVALGAVGDRPGKTSPPGRAYRVYHRFRDGTRVAGVYRPDAVDRSRVFEITLGPAPLVGAHFKSPSGAAVAIIRARHPERKCPNTDGWLFWCILGRGKKLDSVRGENSATYLAKNATGNVTNET